MTAVRSQEPDIQVASDILQAIKNVKDARSCLRGLRALRQAMRSANAPSVLDHLIAFSPRLEELVALWDAYSKSQEHKLQVALLLAITDLLETAAGDRTFASAAATQGNARRVGGFFEPPTASFAGASALATALLSRRLKSVYYHLTSQKKDRATSALLVLAAIAALGPSFARELVRIFDFSLSALPELSRPRKGRKGESADDATTRHMWEWASEEPLDRPTRAAFISWALAMLRSADSQLLPEVVTIRPLLGGVLHHLVSDPYEVQAEVLSTLVRKRVVLVTSGGGGGGAHRASLPRHASMMVQHGEGSNALSPANRAQVLTDAALSQLSAIAAAAEDDDGASEEGLSSDQEMIEQGREEEAANEANSGDDETMKKDEGHGVQHTSVHTKPETQVRPRRASDAELKAEAAKLARAILLAVVMHPSNGLCADEASIASFTLLQAGVQTLSFGRKRLLRWLQRLRPWESSVHGDVLRECTARDPALAAAMLLTLPQNVEPVAQGRWMVQAGVVAGLLSATACAPVGLKSLAERGHPPPLPGSRDFQALLHCAFPSALTRAALSRGVQHTNLLVRHAVLCLMAQMLRSMENMLDDASAAVTMARARTAIDTTQSIDAWQNVLESLQHACRNGLPDLQTVLAQFAIADTSKSPAPAELGCTPLDALPTNDKDGEAGAKRASSNSQCASEVILSAALTTLRSWKVCLPSAFSQDNVTVERLLPKDLIGVGEPYLQLQYLALLNAEHEAKMRLPFETSTSLSGCGASSADVEVTGRQVDDVLTPLMSIQRMGASHTAALVSLLRLLRVTENADVALAAHRWLHRRLLASSMFETNADEAVLWLHVLRNFRQTRDVSFSATFAAPDFFADAVALLLRRPDEFYQPALHESPLVRTGGGLSMLSLCVLRQSVRFLGSTKRSSAEKADVAAFAAAALGQVALQQSTTSGSFAALFAGLYDILVVELARVTNKAPEDVTRTHAQQNGGNLETQGPKVSGQKRRHSGMAFSTSLNDGSTVDTLEGIEMMLQSFGADMQPLIDVLTWLKSVHTAPAAQESAKKKKRSRKEALLSCEQQPSRFVMPASLVSGIVPGTPLTLPLDFHRAAQLPLFSLLPCCLATLAVSDAKQSIAETIQTLLGVLRGKMERVPGSSGALMKQALHFLEVIDRDVEVFNASSEIKGHPVGAQAMTCETSLLLAVIRLCLETAEEESQDQARRSLDVCCSEYSKLMLKRLSSLPGLEIGPSNGLAGKGQVPTFSSPTIYVTWLVNFSKGLHCAELCRPLVHKAVRGVERALASLTKDKNSPKEGSIPQHAFDIFAAILPAACDEHLEDAVDATCTFLEYAFHSDSKGPQASMLDTAALATSMLLRRVSNCREDTAHAVKLTTKACDVLIEAASGAAADDVGALSAEQGDAQTVRQRDDIQGWNALARLLCELLDVGRSSRGGGNAHRRWSAHVIERLNHAAPALLKRCFTCLASSSVHAACALLGACPAARDAFPAAMHAALSSAAAAGDKYSRRIRLAPLLPTAVAYIKHSSSADDADARFDVAKQLIHPLIAFLSAPPRRNTGVSPATVSLSSPHEGAPPQGAASCAAVLFRIHAIPCLRTLLVDVIGAQDARYAAEISQQALNSIVSSKGWSIDHGGAAIDPGILGPITCEKAASAGTLLRVSRTERHASNVSTAQFLVPVLRCFCQTLASALLKSSSHPSTLQHGSDSLDDALEDTIAALLSEIDGPLGDAVADLSIVERQTTAFAEIAREICRPLAHAIFRHRPAEPSAMKVLRRFCAALLPVAENSPVIDEGVEEGLPPEHGDDVVDNGTNSDDDSSTDAGDISPNTTTTSSSSPSSSSSTSSESDDDDDSHAKKLKRQADAAASIASQIDDQHCINVPVSTVATELFHRIVTHSGFLSAMRCSVACPPGLPPGTETLPRPLQTVLPVAELDPSADPTENVATAAVKKELCELLETLLDIKETFEPTESNEENMDRVAVEDGLLRVVLASYGGSLSGADMAAWSLARALNYRAWKRRRAPGGDDAQACSDAPDAALFDASDDKHAEIAYVKALFEGPLAQRCFAWGPFAIAAADHIIGSTTPLTASSIDSFIAALPLDPIRCALLVCHFPEWRTLSEDDTIVPAAGSETKASNEALAGPPACHAAYDPSFLIPFCANALRRKIFSPRLFLQSGLVSVCFRATASADAGLRAVAYEALGLLERELHASAPNEANKQHHVESQPIVVSSDFKERRQLAILFGWVRNALPTAFVRMPTFHAVFAAEAALMIACPANPVYRHVTKTLLKTACIDVTAMPLFRQLVHSGSQEGREERVWLLRMLLASLRSADDALLYRKSYVFQLVMAMRDFAATEKMASKLALRVICRAALIPKAAKELCEQSSLVVWLAQAAADAASKGVHDRGTAGTAAESDAVAALEALQRLTRLRVAAGSGRGGQRWQGHEDFRMACRLLVSKLVALVPISHRLPEDAAGFMAIIWREVLPTCIFACDTSKERVLTPAECAMAVSAAKQTCEGVECSQEVTALTLKLQKLCSWDVLTPH